MRLTARQGSLPALLYRPRLGGPRPGVVLAAEAYGINVFTRRIAATLAHLGYVTLVPDYTGVRARPTRRAIWTSPR